jgi:2-dehydropantoate 2-reductase
MPHPKPRSLAIGVVGAGAIGGWVAAKLALAGNRVSILARGEARDAIERDGLVLSEQGATRTATVAVSRDAESIGRQDVLVIAVKAPSLSDAAESARGMIGPDTRIVPMLNGVPWWFIPGEALRSVDPGGRVAAALPLAQVIGCVVHASCRRTGFNSVEVSHADKLIFGEPGGGLSERVADLAALFESAGIRTEPSDNVRRAIWYKLWGNMTINPISALTRATADRILASDALKPFILAAMAEAAAVGAAIGCPIEESGEDRMAVTARLGAFKTSMLQDVEAGRRLELEALLGAPREIGARAGIATPNIDTLYALTRLLDEGWTAATC